MLNKDYKFCLYLGLIYNLFIITKFQGDPELGGGYLERNMYSVKRAPSTRTIMGGLSLTL